MSSPSGSGVTHLDRDRSRVDTVVIGGGQAGLTVGFHLKRLGVDFVILDASARVGDAWRKRWDSLMLFTPARMNGLPEMPFPAAGNSSVSKDQVADYLEEYAAQMDLPVRSGVKVSRLYRDGDDYVVEAGPQLIRAAHVVVAMANYQVPHVPGFAPDLSPDIVQMHSTQYRNLSQLQDGDVLVVGAGNSGAEISKEATRSHRTFLAGTESGSIPFRLESWFGRHIGTRLVRFGAIRVLSTSTPIGRKARPKMLDKSAPLVRVRPQDIVAAGVERVGRVNGVENGLPVVDGQGALDVANVIWCTGFKPGFDWIDLDVFDDAGRPRHERGVVPEHPGLYFVGLFFLHALWSETLPGVQIDARYAVQHLVSHGKVAAG